MVTIRESKKPSVPVVRMCCVCRTRIDKTYMLRIVKTRDNKFFVDGTGKADGRGAYICKSSVCVTKGIKARAFNRSFKCQIPEEIYQQVTNTD